MTRLMNISIRRQLLIAFGIIVVLSATVGIVAFTINSSIRTSLAQVRKAALHKAEGVSVMAESLRELQGYEQEILVEKYRGKKGSMQGPDSSAVARINGIIAATCDQFVEKGVVASRQDSKEDLRLSQNQGHLADAQEAQEELNVLDQIQQTFSLYVDDLKRSVASNTEPPSEEYLAQHLKGYKNVSDLVETYEHKERRQLDSETHAIEDSLQRSNSILLCFALVILAISSFLIWYIDRLISHPIDLLKTGAQRISRGDLQSTVELDSENEFGLLARTFNQMTRDLQMTTVSKDYVDSILKSMVNTLIVLRADHAIQSVNDATLRLLGYAPSDLIGRPMEVVLKDSLVRSETVLDEVRQKGFLTEVEVNYLTKEGHVVPMSLSASVIRNSAGTITGIVCVAQDMSERKRAEDQLAEANRHLLDTSRRAGMAEVATSVIHNVGNVLNSVNVSSALISDKVQNSKIGNLTKAAALIEQHQSNLSEFLSTDPKGKQLPSYLTKLAENLVHEQQEILQEASLLVKNILHIREIVNMQQSYARVSGVAELLDVRELMEDAVRINIGSLERHQIKLIREYSDVSPIPMEKHKVLQILVNLIRNAKYACDDSGRNDKEVIIRVAQEKDQIQFSVIDNGIGIPAENLSRIFSHGFTTKKDGHGFGLHSGALAAEEMGGTLTATSDGPGKGASFILDLPIPPTPP